MAQLDQVAAPITHVHTDRTGKFAAEAAKAVPVSGTDYGVPVYANLGSAVVPVSSVETGTPNMATGQVSVTSAGVNLVASRATRRSILITNLGTVDVYIGVNGVSTSTGQLLPGTKGATIALIFTGAIYAIVSSTSQSISYTEFYD